ncbi:hypothetical protein [Candidatus Uabimicrobium sp. HlEnr_7]|uniref:protein kinase domain-containing protein n=1 Tax=Candidatus Uabimicrobium helgolandensis TaxID=3095367 RepID=UPI003557033C
MELLDDRCDLKLVNIMIVGKTYRPKILDLGIAKSTNKELTAITKTGGLVGTPAYMSPEQISGNHSENTDVFGLAM